MRVTDVKTYIVNLNFRNAIFVKVETDEGITGISETVMKRKTLSLEQSILEFKPYLIGQDPTEIEGHWEKMYRDSFWLGDRCTAVQSVRSTVRFGIYWQKAAVYQSTNYWVGLHGSGYRSIATVRPAAPRKHSRKG